MPTPTRPAPVAARSMADDVRARTDAELHDLLHRRQDLARPAPADLSALAARASTRASVQRAVDSLDLAHLQVLEAASSAPQPVTAEALAALLGATTEQVAPTVDDLWALALLWRSPEGLRVVRTVGEVLVHPAGLGPSASDLAGRPTAPDDVAALVDQAPAAARAILDRLTWGPPVAVLPAGTPERVATGARWLLEHHLVASVGPEQLVLPREVALALR
ncbi:hypothetical protein AB4Z02_18655, partial [Pedococcus sp. 2YAF34]